AAVRQDARSDRDPGQTFQYGGRTVLGRARSALPGGDLLLPDPDPARWTGWARIRVPDDAPHQRHLPVHVHADIAQRPRSIRDRWSWAPAELLVPTPTPTDPFGLQA